MRITKIFSIFKLTVLGILFVFGCAECFANNKPAMTVHKLEGGGTVIVPSTMKVAKASPVEDFVLYSVIYPKGNVGLLIYVGNHPQALVEHKGQVTQSNMKIGGFPAVSTNWSCNNSQKQQLYCGDVRIRLLEGSGWPAFVHMSYKDLSKSELASTQKIIDSFSKEIESN